MAVVPATVAAVPATVAAARGREAFSTTTTRGGLLLHLSSFLFSSSVLLFFLPLPRLSSLFLPPFPLFPSFFSSFFLFPSHRGHHRCMVATVAPFPLSFLSPSISPLPFFPFLLSLLLSTARRGQDRHGSSSPSLFFSRLRRPHPPFSLFVFDLGLG